MKDNLTHDLLWSHEAGTAESVRKTWSTIFRLVHEGSSKTRSEYCEDSKFGFLAIGKSISFTVVVLAASNLSLRTDLDWDKRCQRLHNG